jgi:hypothetical protein
LFDPSVPFTEDDDDDDKNTIDDLYPHKYTKFTSFSHTKNSIISHPPNKLFTTTDSSPSQSSQNPNSSLFAVSLRGADNEFRNTFFPFNAVFDENLISDN